jgi:hypothetical protein
MRVLAAAASAVRNALKLASPDAAGRAIATGV